VRERIPNTLNFGQQEISMANTNTLQSRIKTHLKPIEIATTIPTLAAIFFLSWAQYINWLHAHGDHINEISAISDEILHGVAYWRAFQNRLLAPAIVCLLGTISIAPMLLFVKISIFTLNCMLYFFARKITGKWSLSIFALLACTFAWTSLENYWSYPWDFVEAGCFLVLTKLAIENRAKAQIVPIFIIALFNRESSAFFGVFIIATASLLWINTKKSQMRLIISGLSFVAIAAVFTEATRALLFKHSSAPGIGMDAAHQTFGNHLYFEQNITQLKEMILVGQTDLPFFLIFAFFSTAMVIFEGIAAKRDELGALGIILFLYLISFMIFGAVAETRLYQPLTWCFGLLIAASMTKYKARPA
jgi:hypothetical protein